MMPTSFVRTTLVSAALAIATRAAAQPVSAVPAAPTLASGTRLRVTLMHAPDTGPLVGRLVASEDSHLLLDTRAHRWTLRWSQVQDVEVAERRPMLVAAGRGAAGGALVGALFAAATPGLGGMLLERWSSRFDDDRLPSNAADAAMTVTTAAAIGFVTGALLNREKWTSIPLPGRETR